MSVFRVWFAAWVLASALTACRRDRSAEAEPEPGPIHVRCEPVTAHTLVEERVLRGSVQFAPERIARVAAEVPGRVRRLAVREGDAVSAGQLVAEVETSLIEDRASAARGELAGARAALEAALATEARLTPLVAHGIAAQQELDDVRVRVAQARGALAALSGNAATSGREVARGTLRAPMAGIVVRVLRGAGELVDGTPATPVVEIADPAALEFVANATAADLVALRVGQTASVRLGSFDATSIAARVDRVAPAVDPVSGIGLARFAISSASNGSHGALPAGLTGEVRVAVQTHAAAVAVRESSLRERDGDDAEVLVCDGEHARSRAVRLGPTAHDGDAGASFVIVRDGLAVGDRVIVDDTAGIEDGATIAEQAR
jgi:RND family efflux transporter MFP subunit